MLNKMLAKDEQDRTGQDRTNRREGNIWELANGVLTCHGALEAAEAFFEVRDSILQPLDYKFDTLPTELTSQP